MQEICRDKMRKGELELGAYSGLAISLVPSDNSGCSCRKLPSRCKNATDGVNCHIWVTAFIKLYLQRFCAEADTKTMLQCLKQNKNSELMDPKCKQMITKRQITQNTGNILAWLSWSHRAQLKWN